MKNPMCATRGPARLSAFVRCDPAVGRIGFRSLAARPDDEAVSAQPKGVWIGGHTLAPALAQVQRLSGSVIERAYVDRGYRGHGLGPGASSSPASAAV